MFLVRPLDARRRRRARGDAGFTLVEVMISMVIFALISTVSAVALMSNLRSTGTNRARVAAADLALREIETVRSAFLSPLKGPQSVLEGRVENPQPDGTEGGPTATTTVDGHIFTVIRESQWAAQGDTSGPCDGGASGPLAYLHVTVTVTWQGMTTAPVTNTTLLTPPLGTYRGGLGNMKVKVTDAANAPEMNTDVTIYWTATMAQVGSPIATSADGCSFFAFLNPGNYTVKVLRTGYVSKQDWLAAPSFATSVAPNAVTSVNIGFTPQATVQLSFDSTLPAFRPPTTTAVTLYSPNLTTTSPYTGWVNTLTVPSTTGTVYPWPDASGVVAWAGDCRDSDPALTGGVRANAYATVAGSTTVTAIGGALVTINVKKAGINTAGVQLEAVHPVYKDATPKAVCPSGIGGMPDPNGDGTTIGEALPLPNVTDAAGNTSVLLPFGVWQFKTLARVPRTASANQTYNANGVYPLVFNMVIS